MDPERPVTARSRQTTIRLLDWLIVVAALVTLIVRFLISSVEFPFGHPDCSWNQAFSRLPKVMSAETYPHRLEAEPLAPGKTLTSWMQ
jgi:hypothetical protein